MYSPCFADDLANDPILFMKWWDNMPTLPPSMPILGDMYKDAEDKLLYWNGVKWLKPR